MWNCSCGNVNTMAPGQNGRHLADDIFLLIFLKTTRMYVDLSYLKFVSVCTFHNMSSFGSGNGLVSNWRRVSSWINDDPVQWPIYAQHDDVIKWKHFPRYWPFVQGIHRTPVNSPHKGQWRGALMFSLIRARINGWVNNREAGDLRRHRPHYDVIVMTRSGLHDFQIF